MAVHDLDAELGKLRIDKSSRRAARRSWGGPVLLMLLVSAAGGAGFVYYARANAAVPVRVIRPEVVESGAASAAPAGTAILTAGGYVIPRDRIQISSKIVGVVRDIFVEAGDQIKEGDLILKIDDEEYAAQVKVAEARVSNLRARLEELKTGSRPQEIATAEAQVVAAQANLAKAKADLDRMERLVKDDIVTQEQVERARESFDVADANLNAAKENAAMVKIGPRIEVIRAIEASLAEALANLEYAQTQMSYTEMRAPITGTILEKIAKKGELVTNSNFGGTRGPQSSVVSMADLSDLQVELDVNENDMPKVKMGQKCEIRLDSNPDAVFKGLVDEIAPQADRQKATVQVKVKMLDPDQTVRPEVSARVTFIEDEKPAEAQPAEAPAGPQVWLQRAGIVEGASGPAVFIVSDGRAVQRSVKLGREGTKGVLVSDGLIGTEQVIATPSEKVKDGVRVEVTP